MRRGIREILGLESNEEKVAERWCFRESADEENIKLRVDCREPIRERKKKYKIIIYSAVFARMYFMFMTSS